MKQNKTKSSPAKTAAQTDTFRRQMARFEFLSTQAKHLLAQIEQDCSRRQTKLKKLIKSYDAALKTLERNKR